MSRGDRVLGVGVLGACTLVLLATGCREQTAGEATQTAPAAVESPGGAPAAAPATPPADEPGETEPSLRFVNPVRGTADVGYLSPKTKVEAGVVVTVIEVKNLSDKPIAGLKVDEFWWDRANNPVTGDSERLRQPLQPGETATLTLRTPKDPRMHRNSYQFSHAYGRVKTTLLRTLD
jgi:hypothetical protein